LLLSISLFTFTVPYLILVSHLQFWFNLLPIQEPTVQAPSICRVICLICLILFHRYHKPKPCWHLQYVFDGSSLLWRYPAARWPYWLWYLTRDIWWLPAAISHRTSRHKLQSIWKHQSSVRHGLADCHSWISPAWWCKGLILLNADRWRWQHWKENVQLVKMSYW